MDNLPCEHAGICKHYRPAEGEGEGEPTGMPSVSKCSPRECMDPSQQLTEQEAAVGIAWIHFCERCNIAIGLPIVRPPGFKPKPTVCHSCGGFADVFTLEQLIEAGRVKAEGQPEPVPSFPSPPPPAEKSAKAYPFHCQRCKRNGVFKCAYSGDSCPDFEDVAAEPVAVQTVPKGPSYVDINTGEHYQEPGPGRILVKGEPGKPNLDMPPEMFTESYRPPKVEAAQVDQGEPDKYFWVWKCHCPTSKEEMARLACHHDPGPMLCPVCGATVQAVKGGLV